MLKLTTVKTDSLRPHPRNYRRHPEDQVAHLAQSIREHGYYRNVVVSRDNVILAGHGVVQAVKSLALPTIQVCRLDLAADDPRALKVLAGDNEIAHLGEVDDRALTELLKEVHSINEEDWDGLFGTGYNEKMLAALAMVTRPAGELEDFNAAAHWVGMPEYEEGARPPQLVLSFRNEADRETIAKHLSLAISQKSNRGGTWSAWWPAKEIKDVSSVRFEAEDE